MRAVEVNRGTKVSGRALIAFRMEGRIDRWRDKILNLDYDGHVRLSHNYKLAPVASCKD